MTSIVISRKNIIKHSNSTIINTPLSFGRYSIESYNNQYSSPSHSAFLKKSFTSQALGVYQVKCFFSKHPKVKSWYSQKLLQLNKITKNWRDSEVAPPNNWALYWASTTLEILREIDFPCERIAESIDEGVCISFISLKNKNKYADIEFFNNGEILAAKSDRVSEPKIWQVSVSNSEISKTLRQIREYIEL
jgi:hypothetical protein